MLRSEAEPPFIGWAGVHWFFVMLKSFYWRGIFSPGKVSAEENQKKGERRWNINGHKKDAAPRWLVTSCKFTPLQPPLVCDNAWSITSLSTPFLPSLSFLYNTHRKKTRLYLKTLTMQIWKGAFQLSYLWVRKTTVGIAGMEELIAVIFKQRNPLQPPADGQRDRIKARRISLEPPSPLKIWS